jgi:hypothetical protein
MKQVMKMYVKSDNQNVNAYYGAAKAKLEKRFISDKPWIGVRYTGENKDGSTFFYFLDKDMKPVYVDKSGNLTDEKP